MIRVLDYAEELAEDNPPIVESGLGTIFYGDPPAVARLSWIPWLQVSALVGLLAALASVIRHNVRTERERIWAAMARESAHQMATPLSSLAGWVEILRLPDEDREQMATLPAVAAEMEADLDRLEKVARRFEWIGRPVQTEAVDVRTLLRVLERYVRVRLPQLGAQRATGGGGARGDAARAGQRHPAGVGAGEPDQERAGRAGGGRRHHLHRERGGGGAAGGDPGDRRRPGVSPAVRATLFDPGVSTKKGGWGVGLSLARRIVEDVHGGRLRLEPSDRGARFVMSLPAAPEPEPTETRKRLPWARQREGWRSGRDGRDRGANGGRDRRARTGRPPPGVPPVCGEGETSGRVRGLFALSRRGRHPSRWRGVAVRERGRGG